VVSGTGTGVGKTVVTAAVAALTLARGARVAVVKPAQTGVGAQEPGDLSDIARLCGPEVADRLTLVEGSRFPDPLSPAAAARVAGIAPADLGRLVQEIEALQREHALVVVEGAGGLLVRFDEEGATVASLAAACDAEVLVVTSAGLGALNATALTLEALAHRGLRLAGLVIGSWPADPDLASASNVADFEMLAARPLSGALPEAAGQLGAAAFTMAAASALAPSLGGRFDPSAFRAAAASRVTRAVPGSP
jgi:dethiobiotin synthase